MPGSIGPINVNDSKGSADKSGRGPDSAQPWIVLQHSEEIRYTATIPLENTDYYAVAGAS